MLTIHCWLVSSTRQQHYSLDNCATGSVHGENNAEEQSQNHPKFTCNHINQKRLAERWDVSQRTLERWRSIGWGPIFLKIGDRMVYWVEDILAYEEQHLAGPIQTKPYVSMT